MGKMKDAIIDAYEMRDHMRCFVDQYSLAGLFGILGTLAEPEEMKAVNIIEARSWSELILAEPAIN